MSVLMAVAIKSFSRTALVVSKRDSVVCLVDATGATSATVTTELDSVTITRESGAGVEVVIYPGVVFGFAGMPSPTLDKGHGEVCFI